jgi:hypothetical protein
LLFAVPVAIALIACFDLRNRTAGLSGAWYFGAEVQAGFADYIMYIYGGMDIYDPGSGDPFVFPVRWVMVLLSVAFLTLNYPWNDMQGIGQQILIRTKGRMTWWLSKCGWSLASVLVYHSLIFLTAATFCSAVHGDFEGGINKELIYAVFRVGRGNMAENGSIWPFSMLLLPVWISTAMSLFQMILSLFIKPLFSFFFTAFVVISSAYFTSPLMIGNYAMTLRYDVAVIGGVNVNAGVMIGLFLFLASAITGCVRFHRYDILNRDQEESS